MKTSVIWMFEKKMKTYVIWMLFYQMKYLLMIKRYVFGNFHFAESFIQTINY